MRKQKNPDLQGEGNRDAARRYDKAARRHARSGASRPAAEQAEHDIEGPGAAELRRAEREGKKHSAGEDPAFERVGDRGVARRARSHAATRAGRRQNDEDAEDTDVDPRASAQARAQAEAREFYDHCTD